MIGAECGILYLQKQIPAWWEGYGRMSNRQAWAVQWIRWFEQNPGMEFSQGLPLIRQVWTTYQEAPLHQRGWLWLTQPISRLGEISIASSLLQLQENTADNVFLLAQLAQAQRRLRWFSPLRPLVSKVLIENHWQSTLGKSDMLVKHRLENKQRSLFSDVRFFLNSLFTLFREIMMQIFKQATKPFRSNTVEKTSPNFVSTTGVRPLFSEGLGQLGVKTLPTRHLFNSFIAGRANALAKNLHLQQLETCHAYRRTQLSQRLWQGGDDFPGWLGRLQVGDDQTILAAYCRALRLTLKACLQTLNQPQLLREHLQALLPLLREGALLPHKKSLLGFSTAKVMANIAQQLVLGLLALAHADQTSENTAELGIAMSPDFIKALTSLRAGFQETNRNEATDIALMAEGDLQEYQFIVSYQQLEQAWTALNATYQPVVITAFDQVLANRRKAIESELLLLRQQIECLALKGSSFDQDKTPLNELRDTLLNLKKALTTEIAAFKQCVEDSNLIQRYHHLLHAWQHTHEASRIEATAQTLAERHGEIENQLALLKQQVEQFTQALLQEEQSSNLAILREGLNNALEDTMLALETYRKIRQSAEGTIIPISPSPGQETTPFLENSPVPPSAGEIPLKLSLAAAKACQQLGLAINQTITWTMIRKAYREMALDYHPDKNHYSKEECEALFQRMQAAYHLLVEFRLMNPDNIVEISAMEKEYLNHKRVIETVGKLSQQIKEVGKRLNDLEISSQQWQQAFGTYVAEGNEKLRDLQEKTIKHDVQFSEELQAQRQQLQEQQQILAFLLQEARARQSNGTSIPAANTDEKEQSGSVTKNELPSGQGNSIAQLTFANHPARFGYAATLSPQTDENHEMKSEPSLL